MPKQHLYSSMNLEKNQSIALLVGAGAVEKAWAPIIRAIQPDYFKNGLSTEGATSYLARLIYCLRWSSNTSKNPDDVDLKAYKLILQNVKENICKEIKLSQESSELSIRNEFASIVDRIILSDCKKLMIVSTNWDTIVEDAINNDARIIEMFTGQKLLAAHIHGIYTQPQKLYLPTEVVEELYRTNEENQFFGMMHASVMKALKEAHIVIFYGLSISPLDAELNQTLGASIDSNTIQSIIIIDPNHAVIAERINLLLKFPTKIIVHAYEPNDLDNLYDYSLH